MAGVGPGWGSGTTNDGTMEMIATMKAAAMTDATMTNVTMTNAACISMYELIRPYDIGTSLLDDSTLSLYHYTTKQNRAIYSRLTSWR